MRQSASQGVDESGSQSVSASIDEESVRKRSSTPLAPVVDTYDGTLAGHDDAETAWRSKGFLGRRDNPVDTPIVHTNLLGTDRADTVHHDQCIG